jgi:voltage-gated potassium channel
MTRRLVEQGLAPEVVASLSAELMTELRATSERGDSERLRSSSGEPAGAEASHENSREAARASPPGGLEKLRRRVYEIVEKAADPAQDPVSYYFDVVIMILIVLNSIAVILETVASLRANYHDWFWNFELVSVVIFSLELLLRLWSCTSSKEFEHPLWGRIRFLTRPSTIIDILAIAPFFVTVFLPKGVLFGLQVPDSRQLRSLRLFRFLRVLKLGRYSRSVDTLANIIRKKKEELVVAMMTVGVMLIFSSTGIYYFESGQNPPGEPDKFASIPESMWWAVATLTTVGYGDVYPQTAAGKFFASIVAILGIGVFALPAGIVASGFSEEMSRKAEGEASEAAEDAASAAEDAATAAARVEQAAEKLSTLIGVAGPRHCPHCGEDVNSPPPSEHS